MTKIHILRLTLILLLSSCIFNEIHKSFEEDTIFDIFEYIVLGVIYACLFLWTSIKDYKAYKNSGSVLHFLSSFLALFLIAIIFSYNAYRKYLFNEPSYIKAYYNGDLDAFSIDLKTSGKYIMTSLTIASSHYFYGTYSIKNSIIILDKHNIDDVIEANTLMIAKRCDTFATQPLEIPKVVCNDYMFQVDDKHKAIKNAFSFLVTADNRAIK